MTDAPIKFQWDGEAMRPATPLNARKCDEQFVVGEVYRLVEHHERSSVSHRHLFACIASTFDNLPEAMGERWETVEHFRKWLTIKAGHFDKRTHVAASNDEALRVAAFIKPIDGYAVLVVQDCTVSVFTAKSISYRTCDKAEFQAVKEKILGICADLIGVATEQLTAAEAA